MTAFTNIPKQVEEVLEKWNVTTSRRNFLKSSGLLVVSFTAAPLIPTAAAQVPATAQAAGGPYPDPDFHQLDSWIVIHEDNTATFYVGKTDLGQGTGTSFRQIMSDELDIPFDKTTCIMGTTNLTVDQGGSGGSDAIQVDGWPMRRVAAEARRVLLDMASKRFGVPVDDLVVSDGVITVKADPTKKVTYGELIGSKKFNVTLTAANNNIDNTTGVAKVKPVQQLKMVGKSPQRYDIPPKVDGSLTWAVDVKLPGMVHARNVKPPVAGAKLLSIDESSVRNIPGLVKVVSKGNYVAVVCEREEHAIQAARQLKVNWEKPSTAAFPTSDDLFKFMRNATPTSKRQPNVVGNPDAALASAAESPGALAGLSRRRRASVRNHSMIRWPADLGPLSRKFEKARPFKHVVLDRVLPGDEHERVAAAFDEEPHVLVENEIYLHLRSSDPPMTPALKRRFWPKKSAVRSECSGCAKRKPPGIPRDPPSHSKFAERSTRRAISLRSISMPEPPTTITSVTTKPIRC